MKPKFKTFLFVFIGSFFFLSWEAFGQIHGVKTSLTSHHLPKVNCKKNWDYACTCPRELGYLLEGRTNINKALFLKGQRPQDKRSIPVKVNALFKSGGSLNIEVNCRAGDYALNQNHQAKWFHAYFDIQFKDNVGFMGREFMSPLYAPTVVAAVTTVHHFALKRKDRQLAAKAARWLRYYYTLLSLGARKQRAKKATYMRYRGSQKRPFKNPSLIHAAMPDHELLKMEKLERDTIPLFSPWPLD